MRFYKKIKANHLIRWQNYKNLFKIKIFWRVLFQIQTFFYNKMHKMATTDKKWILLHGSFVYGFF